MKDYREGRLSPEISPELYRAAQKAAIEAGWPEPPPRPLGIGRVPSQGGSGSAIHHIEPENSPLKPQGDAGVSHEWINDGAKPKESDTLKDRLKEIMGSGSDSA